MRAAKQLSGDKEMAIASVEVSEDRKRELGSIERLKESIAEVGLLQPIVITTGRMLVAGLHRLEACRQLGWETIPVRIVALDAIRAELAEIDENLVRTELTTLQKSEHLQRRMEIYESLNPVAKHGGNPGAGRGKGSKRPSNRDDESSSLQTESFADNTARKLGTSPRQVQRLVQVARLSDDDKAKIKGTPLENNHDNLLKLVREKDDDQRGKLIDTIVSGEAKNVAEAREQLGIKPSRQSAARSNDEKVAELYGKLGPGDIAKELNITPGQVQHARLRMGIPGSKGKVTNPLASLTKMSAEFADAWEAVRETTAEKWHEATQEQVNELLGNIRRARSEAAKLINAIERELGSANVTTN